MKGAHFLGPSRGGKKLFYEIDRVNQSRTAGKNLARRAR
jgi:hypothetical protein